MSGFITKKGGGRPLLINGQEVVSGIYQEAISQFDTVFSTRGDLLELNKLTDPEILPVSGGNGTAFSPDGTYLAVAVQSVASPLIIYKRSGDTFTRLPDPDVLPP
jgi:hypothetical protein